MSHRLTQKQESFALKYVECGNASEAYRHAYNAEKMGAETIWVKACELLKHDKVSVRIEELQAEHREAHDITVGEILGELAEDRKLAHAKGQSSAAVSATMGKAKITGHLVEQHHLTAEINISSDRKSVAQRFAERLLGDNE